MNSIFNSDLELSLRILLTLYTSDKELNVDEILLSDFITVYSFEFGLDNSNLHGINEFSYSELAARREQFISAIKTLALNKYIIFTVNSSGFSYKISELGESTCDSMTTDYAFAYINSSIRAHEYMNNKTTTELLTYINQMAMKKKQEAL